MLKKKGVSPLIATVLLLAFAVALATVILQLDLFEGCNVEVTKLNGIQRVCVNEETTPAQIEIFIENLDKNKEVIGIKVVGTGEKNVFNIENQGVKLLPKEQKKIIIPYDKENIGTLQGIKIYPWTNSSGYIKACNGMNEEIMLHPIPTCPKVE